MASQSDKQIRDQIQKGRDATAGGTDPYKAIRAMERRQQASGKS